MANFSCGINDKYMHGTFKPYLNTSPLAVTIVSSASTIEEKEKYFIHEPPSYQ